LAPEQIRDYFGQEVTLAGTANYRPGGKLGFIMIERIFPPGKGDAYFSKRLKLKLLNDKFKSNGKKRGIRTI